MDVKSFASNYKIFGEIDKINDEFYKFIEDKGIEIKDVSDIERVEVKFNKSLDELIKLCDSSNLDKHMAQVVKARVIVTFHATLAEKYKLEPYAVIAKLGKRNEDLFTKSMINLKNLS